MKLPQPGDVLDNDTIVVASSWGNDTFYVLLTISPAGPPYFWVAQYSVIHGTQISDAMPAKNIGQAVRNYRDFGGDVDE